MSGLELDFEKKADKITMTMSWGDQSIERVVPIDTTSKDTAKASSSAVWNALFAMAWCMGASREQLAPLLAKLKHDLEICRADELFLDMING